MTREIVFFLKIKYNNTADSITDKDIDTWSDEKLGTKNSIFHVLHSDYLTPLYKFCMPFTCICKHGRKNVGITSLQFDINTAIYKKNPTQKFTPHSRGCC